MLRYGNVWKTSKTRSAEPVDAASEITKIDFALSRKLGNCDFLGLFDSKQNKIKLLLRSLPILNKDKVYKITAYF